jgi:hypothetical protein
VVRLATAIRSASGRCPHSLASSVTATGSAATRSAPSSRAKRVAPTNLAVPCDFGTGTAGGPWLSEFNGFFGAVVSVTTFRIEGQPDLFGPYQGAAARALFEATRAA